MLIIGIDNGVTGTVAILSRMGRLKLYMPMPVIKELSYTKTKQHISRISHASLSTILRTWKDKDKHCICYIERPMLNPGRFKASVSALRALEATLVVLEQLRIPYRYIDSKEWQGALLPKGLAGNELKKAAVDVARRLFPNVKTKDADGLLIAEYARRQYQ